MAGWNPFSRMGMSSAVNVAAWLVAGGIAVWWQSRESVDGNQRVFSALEAAQWNARKKAAAAGAEDPSSADAPSRGAGR